MFVVEMLNTEESDVRGGLHVIDSLVVALNTLSQLQEQRFVRESNNVVLKEKN